MSAVATGPPTPPSPPPGAEHAYDVLASRVIRQLSDADSLDTKLGAAVAILVALAGAVYAAQPPRIFAAIVSGWLAVALVQAIRGFTYDTKFADGVTAKFLTDRLALDSPAIKWHFDLPHTHAYDVQSAVFVMDRLAVATGRRRYADLARKARRWFDGRNPACTPIYDRAVGRVADGLDDQRVSDSSGAEANITACLALLGDPGVLEQARHWTHIW